MSASTENEQPKKTNPFKSFATHWKTPAPGNSVNNFELITHCFASMGVGAWNPIKSALGMSASAAVIGRIYGIVKTMDLYYIGLVAFWLPYLLAPLTAYITDNMGKLSKKFMIKLYAGSAGALALCTLLWFIPSHSLDRYAPDLLKHLAITILMNLFSMFLNLFILKFLGTKYGKFKPSLVIFGIPTFIFVMILVHVPAQDMNYSSLLLLVHVLTGLMGLFGGDIGGLEARMSNNPQERVRLFTFPPIFNGIMRELFGIILPLFGDQLNIKTWRTIIPLYCAFITLEGLLIVFSKDRVIQEKNHVATVKMKGAAKHVFTNKYLWIGNISGLFNLVGDVQTLALTTLLLYGSRMQWLTGVMISLFKLPTSAPGNIVGQFYTKRMEKRSAILLLHTIMTVMSTGLLIPIVFLPQSTNNYEIVQLVMVMVLCGLQTFFSCSNDVISRTITPDIWDYQQWKTGERLEASNGLLSTYIFGPIGIAMGIIMPFILKIIGFTSDWNIFYDADIRNRYITVNIIIGALSNLLPAIPYMFYDLNKDKMLKINADLLERAAAKDAENEAFAAVPAEGGAAE